MFEDANAGINSAIAASCAVVCVGNPPYKEPQVLIHIENYDDVIFEYGELKI